MSLHCLVIGIWGSAYASDALTLTPPAHWFISGQESAQGIKEYIGVTDHAIAYEGSGSGLLKSLSSVAHDGTLMQFSSAVPYRGKTLEMTAFLRSSKVAQRAGIWIRADDVGGTTVAFRNCLNPHALESFITGNTDWRAVKISVDVPKTAVALSYGVQMIGTGEVWIDNITFDVMGPAHLDPEEYVNPTRHRVPDLNKLSPMPQNLNFEQ